MSVRPKRPAQRPWLDEWLDRVEADHAEWTEERERILGRSARPLPPLEVVEKLRDGRPAEVQGVRLPRAVLIEHGLHPRHLWRFVTVYPDGSVTPD